MTAPKDAATSHGNVTTFHFHNGIRLIVPTEAAGPSRPSTAGDPNSDVAIVTVNTTP